MFAKMVGQSFRFSYITWFVTVAIFVLLNWNYDYQTIATSNRVLTVREIHGGFSQDPARREIKMSRAGFPFVYRQAIDYAYAAPLVTFSAVSLACNVLLWTTLLAVVLLYERFTRFRTTCGKEERLKRGLLLSDIMLVTTILAAALAYYGVLDARRAADESLLAKIGYQRGSGLIATQVPTCIAGIFPDALVPTMARIVEVTAYAPDDDLLLELARRHHLTGVRLFGGSYSDEKLFRLMESTQLLHLGIFEKKLSPELLDRISEEASLDTLRISDITLPASEMQSEFSKIGKLERLSRLDVRESGVPFSYVKALPNLAQMETIGASFVTPADVQNQNAALIEFTGFPNLRYLALLCTGGSDSLRDVQVAARDLPELRRLDVATDRPVKLVIDECPKLEYMDGNYWELDLRKAESAEPTDPYLSSLSILSPTALRRVGLRGEALRDVKLVGHANSILSVKIPKTSTADLIDGERTRQNWISMLPAMGEIAEIDLGELPLQGVDLRPLAKCTWAKRVYLNGTSISDAQLRQLAEELRDVHWELLSIVGTQLSPITVRRLTERLPSLKSLPVSFNDCSQVWIENHPKLESLLLYPRQFYPTLSRVRLVNVPNLVVCIDVSPYADYVHIEGVPSLYALTFCGELPAHCVLKDLQKLFVFAAGGKAVNDALFDEVFASHTTIRKLSLPHSSVSENRLKRIDEFKSLESLNLIGCKVTDDIILNWDLSQLPKLKYLRLDYTQISERSLRHLSQLPLSVLTFYGTKSVLSPDLLLSFKVLKRLGIGGCTLTPEMIRALGQIKTLGTLDLSQSTLTGEVANAFCNLSLYNIRTLLLDEATIDAKVLHYIFSNPTVLVSVENTICDPELMDRVIASGRNSGIVSERADAASGSSGYTLYFHEFFGTGDSVPERAGYFRGDINAFAFSPTNIRQTNAQGWGRRVGGASTQLESFGSESSSAGGLPFGDEVRYEAAGDMTFKIDINDDSFYSGDVHVEPVSAFEILGKLIGRFYLQPWGYGSTK